MTDLSLTIAPKSDQLNSDDLIGRARTIKVSKVSLCAEPDQPIAVHFDGDNGKPYKPCKSMRRVLVQVWGSDGNAYVGRRMTLYRDDKVQFGGMAVGGIRISHMSDIDRDITMALTATRANRKPFTVRPMPAEKADDTPAKPKLTPIEWANQQLKVLTAMEEPDQLYDWLDKNGKTLSALKAKDEATFETLNGIVNEARLRLDVALS